MGMSSAITSSYWPHGYELWTSKHEILVMLDPSPITITVHKQTACYLPMISQEGHLSASRPLTILVPAPHPCKLGQKPSPHAERRLETPIAKSSFHAFYLEASTHHHAPLHSPTSILRFPPSLKMVLCPVCTIQHSQHILACSTENPVFHWQV